MPGKKGSATAEKELKATVKTLRSDLAATKAKLKRSKKKVAGLQRSLSNSETRVKSLKKAGRRSMERAPSVVEAPSVGPPAAAGASKAASSTRDVRPDDSWTVVRLRAEARSRGLTGLSNKPKAELLAALT